MGKATGFMEYDRQDKKAEAPKERTGILKSFINHYRKKNRKFREQDVCPVVYHSVSLVR